MVQNGKTILTEQGRDPNSLSEAECVAAYILSDMYTTQDPELSRALGETAGLADTIKSTFYYTRDGSDDTYAVYRYSTDSAKFAERFEQRVTGTTQENSAPEHEER